MTRFLPVAVAMAILFFAGGAAASAIGSSSDVVDTSSSSVGHVSRTLFTSSPAALYDQVDLSLVTSNAVEFDTTVAMSDDQVGSDDGDQFDMNAFTSSSDSSKFISASRTLIGKFDWDIVPLKEPQIVFTESSDTSEIHLFYNITRRHTEIQAYEDDCLTPIPSYITSLTSDTVEATLSHDNFTVNVNIAQDNITTYPSVWQDNRAGQGLISMCIRVDLMLNSTSDVSVHFLEQKLYVSIDLVQGFEITGIDLDRRNATEVTGTANFDYDVTGCHCDSTGTCINEILTQGSDIILCIETTSPNIKIKDVKELTMSQGTTFSTTPIVNYSEDALTETTLNGKKATVRYQIISEFFVSPNPEDIVATGSVLLEFTDDDAPSGRFLRQIVQVGRSLQQENEDVEDDFTVIMSVESATAKSAADPAAAIAVSAVSFMVIVIAGIVLG